MGYKDSVFSVLVSWEILAALIFRNHPAGLHVRSVATVQSVYTLPLHKVYTAYQRGSLRVCGKALWV